jgi:hypothetical protein
VIREPVSDDVPITENEEFSGIPSSVGNHALDNELIKRIIRETNDVNELRVLLNKLKKGGNKVQIKLLKQRIREINSQNKNSTEVEPNAKNREIKPQFYADNNAMIPPEEIPENEFIENFTEPELKKELYKALIDVYTQYRDKDPSLNLAPVKKRSEGDIYLT